MFKNILGVPPSELTERFSMLANTESNNSCAPLERQSLSHIQRERWALVKAWLSDVYTSRRLPLPAFEENPETLKLLYNLARRWKKREEIERLLAQSEHVHEREYREEADRMERVLSLTGVTLSSLSRNGQVAVKALALTAAALGLADVRLSGYQRAIHDLTKESANLEFEYEKYNFILQTTRKKQCEVNENLLRSRKLHEKINVAKDEEDLKLRSWTRNAELLAEKGREYRHRLKSLESWYAKSSITDKGLRLADLIQLEEQMYEALQEVKRKELELQSYQNMPPDLTLAKLKLEEAQQKKYKLRQLKEDALSGIADHVGL